MSKRSGFAFYIVRSILQALRERFAACISLYMALRGPHAGHKTVVGAVCEFLVTLFCDGFPVVPTR